MPVDKTKFDANAAGMNLNAGGLAIYKTADNIATVEGANYFNGLADIIADKTFLLCHMGDGAKLYTVAVSSGVVTLPTEIALA